jgi:TolA-binding protein
MAALIRDHMASRDCEAWLSQARSYIRSRRNLDKARQLLHDIIKKYPRTTYADQATEELSKLR